MHIIVERTISAPVEVVFRTVADIREFQKVSPEIKNVEFLTERQSGVGTRFRETREMKGKKVSTVLEVTEYTENESIRLVSEAGGSVWDSTFAVSQTDYGTALTLHMEARPKHIFARLMNRLMRSRMEKELVKDVDAVKKHCERN